MNWTEIIIQLLKTAPWFVLIVLVILERKIIVSQIGRLTSISYKDFKAEFGSVSSEIDGKSKEINDISKAELATAENTPEDEWDDIYVLVTTHPQSAVLKAWDRFLLQLTSLAQDLGINTGISQAQMIAALEAHVGRADPQLVRSVNTITDVGIIRDHAISVIGKAPQGRELEAANVAAQYVQLVRRGLAILSQALTVTSELWSARNEKTRLEAEEAGLEAEVARLEAEKSRLQNEKDDLMQETHSTD